MNVCITYLLTYLVATFSSWKEVTAELHHCPTSLFSSDNYILCIDKSAPSVSSSSHLRQEIEWNKRALASFCFSKLEIFQKWCPSSNLHPLVVSLDMEHKQYPLL